MDIEDFSLDFLSDIDITAIFSSLLDNAIDACDTDNGRQSRTNTLYLKYYAKGMIIMEKICFKKKGGTEGGKGCKEVFGTCG